MSPPEATDGEASASERDEAPSLGDLAKSERGAVYVEFLIAFLPVLLIFLTTLQLALLFTIKLYVDHAAVQGARTAAVVMGDEPRTYNNEQMNRFTRRRMEFVRTSVLLTLAPLILDGSINSVDVTYPRADQPSGPDANSNRTIGAMTENGAQMVRVNVSVQARCKIAIADRFACANALGFGDSPFSQLVGGGITKTVRSTAIFPYQGASYTYRNR